ncbi:GNAT family N-acetyltransferase [Arcanobacterium haemolyticum]|uniref:GCN5-related N-acetyltransferase n=1 Tax=Arcanobacterium haemolyticum (strain ATCC 9345 / DSM 20595 / CCM 5947 / CCUG 17215 / LMG 16163 / NBRC 15585 / NCTC 8452 / 11018) TaxID=644284 RepID=D7BK40_ARCHD|nr:GNAT family N-acetyltransferase [Arcanobacterium haemolyticum]ADH93020.1 GCN5-related N-acetyltransferase [Arcanobacterium haemolyticum DSM 20595]QCX47087.1 GNAT family N-acetyltransferase [Arcanobacterium haemolyticum]SPT75673.1 aminoalkylphosphonic acid N-acetyltransferase [Arcanobacterium haemolyticum]SQH28223.1 aminoalkylphosphonic acid N-acetyltransferase [Arcanobacterium haemolyticum]
MGVELVSDVTPDLEAAFGRLIGQLSRSATPMNAEQIEGFLAQECVDLLVFRDEDADDSGVAPILGMLTLVTFEIPTGWRAWVEDVVVDEAARGKGVGASLVAAAIDLAKKRGAKTVDLTSRPSREAANRLYQRSGFELRETNVYRVNN